MLATGSTFTFETAEGFDTDLPVALRSRVPQEFQTDGWSTLFAASSDYARRGRTLEIAGTVSSAIRYYHEIDRLDTLSHAAGLGFAVKLPKQGNFRVDSTAAYSPSYLYQLFPVGTPPSLGASIPTNPDYRIAENRVVLVPNSGGPFLRLAARHHGHHLWRIQPH